MTADLLADLASCSPPEGLKRLGVADRTSAELFDPRTLLTRYELLSTVLSSPGLGHLDDQVRIFPALLVATCLGRRVGAS
jgi:hypothetical protein